MRYRKNIGVFLSENFQFLEVKFSIYLNRRVFVMFKFGIQVKPLGSNCLTENPVSVCHIGPFSVLACLVIR